MEKLELKNVKNVLILGATGGIGKSLVDYLLAENSSLEIYAVTRSPLEHPRVHNQIAPKINEASLSEFLSSIQAVKFELIINTVGYLEN